MSAPLKHGSTAYDAVVVGAGPNGLAAAIRLAQEKLSVLVLEANPDIGGGARSAELTLPGFLHDVCSAVHPMVAASPFFRSLPLDQFGLAWIQPEFPLAHPLSGGQAAVLHRSVADTAAGLGGDGAAYARLMRPLAEHWSDLSKEFLRPLPRLPRHPIRLARFGLGALQSASRLAHRHFKDEPARALFAGLAAHSFLPMEQPVSAAFGLVLGMAGHGVGWPIARGGSGRIAEALAALLRSLGGEIATGQRVESLSQLPSSRAVLLNVTPRQALRIAGEKFPPPYRRRLEQFPYGPGVFKVDYALDSPIPWLAKACLRAGTVHVCGGFDEVAASEREAARNRIAERPFVLLAQPTLFDSSRAPHGKHIAWAYCHVPSGSTVDMTDRIERQIERFAPGFRDLILARHTANCAELEARNANLVGGSISGGATDLWHLIARPIPTPTPYRTPLKGVYFCSASTPPGGGVHGLCGFHAAEAALRDCFR